MLRRRHHGDPLAVVTSPGGVEHHAAGGVGLGAAVGEHRLDQLMLGDGPAELHAAHGELERVGDEPLGDADAHGGDVEPAAIEHLHGRLEAHALSGRAADDRRLGAPGSR